MDQSGKAGSASKQGRLAREPMYVVGKEGHYGSCHTIASSGQAPPADAYTGVWANINQGLHGVYRDVLTTYWQATLQRIEDEDHDYKNHQLPLARIKKVMKADPEVKMISAEAPILFAKGCDIFVTELTMRAWIHAEENKRRTLQRSDISAALLKSDMFDFLIDIVPREEANTSASTNGKRTQQQQQQQPPPQSVHPPGGIPAHMAQPGMPPQHTVAQHHPGPHDYPAHFAGQMHHAPDPRYDAHTGHPMYATAPGAPGQPQPADYGTHPQTHPSGPHQPPTMYQMAGDPSQGMYGAYPMAAHQMYQQHQGQQQHPGAPQPPQLPAP